MTNPKIELREYIRKLIDRFVFILDMDDELKNMQTWENRPDGHNALDEGFSFFNIVQRSFNQTLLIELCKFISDDEEKCLLDFLEKAKIHCKAVQPTKLETERMKREIITPMEYYKIIEKNITVLDSYSSVRNNLKARRDKALAHTDAAIFNNPEKHYEAYPLMAKEIDRLLKTIEEILKEHALYLLNAAYDLKLHTEFGVNRVLEFMRGYYRIVHEDSDALKYRWDDYKKEFK